MDDAVKGSLMGFEGDAPCQLEEISVPRTPCESHRNYRSLLSNSHLKFLQRPNH